jgi:hypothetical protein
VEIAKLQQIVQADSLVVVLEILKLQQIVQADSLAVALEILKLRQIVPAPRRERQLGQQYHLNSQLNSSWRSCSTQLNRSCSTQLNLSPVSAA